MSKNPSPRNSVTLTFYCTPLERVSLQMAMARTGLSLSGALRLALKHFTQPLLDELRAAAGQPPEGVDPEAWVRQFGERQVAAAKAARLRAEADALDAGRGRR